MPQRPWSQDCSVVSLPDGPHPPPPLQRLTPQHPRLAWLRQTTCAWPSASPPPPPPPLSSPQRPQPPPPFPPPPPGPSPPPQPSSSPRACRRRWHESASPQSATTPRLRGRTGGGESKAQPTRLQAKRAPFRERDERRRERDERREAEQTRMRGRE
eukprot:4704266-Pleurochrysis_carterae.AAC.4